ncbi:MAG: YggS family pyridoxal phosphate-dependent enzyme [Gammaproteobacteria bacterium]|nr:YggS family pyridoxal phosphate-dependent enzyme [Gammaproteobacteria bacterium]
MHQTPNIAENLSLIQQKISDYATKYGRPASEIQLLAVSKTKSAKLITLAYEAGQKAFAENYLQEALDKIQQLAPLDICWHFIGSIQSNKTQDIASHFDWVHSVDRFKIARRLSDQRPADRGPLNICLQLNINHEESKSGIDLDELADLASRIRSLPNIKLRGLMAIPAQAESFTEQRRNFKSLHDALTRLNQQGHALDTLSMGMSNDMEAAIAEGATIVRIGTAIFGAREAKTS